MAHSKPNRKKSKRSKTPKNPVKTRLEVLERVMGEGINQLIGEIQRLDRNVAILANGIDDIDINVASMRAVLDEKGICSTEAFLEKKEEIVKLKQEAIARIQTDAKAAAEEALRVQQELVENPGVDPSLLGMKKAAEDAGESGEHPDGAFVFGG